ncbi:hypothetical protein LXL04_007814 [Taraxacum kok-saghyz]
MSSLIILALSDFQQPFDVTIDASGVAIGAVLSQNDKPISFFRKKLNDRMQDNSTYARELYAITESVTKWRQYLLGRHFRIYTDHHSLKHLLTQTIQTPEQHKWLTKLMGYDFELHYKPGKVNRVVDALSHIDHVALFPVSGPTATWLEELRFYFQEHPDGKQLIQQMEQDPTSIPHHKLQDGLVYFQSRLFIPNIPHIRLLLLQEFHNSNLGGHSGINSTTRRLAASFYWPKMKTDITNHVHQYSTCQTTKYPTHKPYGLLQPLPVPAKPWNDITVDFITHLPTSNRKTAIWVLVDRLTKFAQFISLPTHFTAASLAGIFLREVYRLHGLPNTIISDRDPIFLSRFWTQLFKQLRTKLRHSSSYHPHTDGQTEVMTPFKSLYGWDASTIHDYQPGTILTASLDTTLIEHQHIIDTLKTNLEQTRTRMTKQANKKRQDKQFQLGEIVYLRLRNYRQHSVESRDCPKLSKRFFGPYRILEKIGPVAYRLQLPTTSRVHPVFHVSLLKQSTNQIPASDFPTEWVTNTPFTEPTKTAILQRRQQGLSTQFLIQWPNTDTTDATWEDADEFQLRFPAFLPGLEDEPTFEGEGIDMAQPGETQLAAQTEESIALARTKRNIKKPQRLMD